MLRAGVSRSAITPPDGMTMLGYTGREGIAQGKDTDLCVTALVLDDERTRIALLAFDLAFVREPMASMLRHEIALRLQVPTSHVLLNASHTHCGPTLQNFHYDDDPGQQQLRDAYAARLLDVVPEVAARAAAELCPVRLGTAVGEARIGINRRELSPDGSIILGENPDGVVDHEVRVIRIDDLTGRPHAVVFAHGCHTVTMGPKCLRWSADYPASARDIVERSLGCPSLFLQANAGDVNPITGIGASEDDSDAKNRLGFTLGGEVLKVHSGIYTDSVRGPRTFFGTFARASLYPRVRIERDADHTLAAAEQAFDLPLERLPDSATAREIYARVSAELDGLAAENAPLARLNIARRWRHWAKALLTSVESGLPPSIRGAVQALRIGDLALAAFPGETFAQLGIDIKRRSPFPHTLFVGYSNGCLCYIPTREAFPRTGWSIHEQYYVPDMLFQAYAVPSGLMPHCGEMVVEKSLELLHGLAAGKTAGTQ